MPHRYVAIERRDAPRKRARLSRSLASSPLRQARLRPDDQVIVKAIAAMRSRHV
jgi:hypothetical protein